MKRTSPPTIAKASLTTLGALALVATTFPGTAFAAGRADAPGQAKKADAAQVQPTSTGYTEDNDTNDGGTPNNVADADDNRHPSGKDRSVEAGGSGTQGKSSSDPDGTTNGGADKPNGPGGIDKADQDGNNGCGNDDDFEDDNNGNCGGKAHTKVHEQAHAKAAEETHVKAPEADHPCTKPMPAHSSATCDSPSPSTTPEQAVVPAAPTSEVSPASFTAAVLGGQVLGNADVAAPAAATTAEAPAQQGEVLGVELEAPAPAVSSRSAAPAVLAAAVTGVGGALAFTGMNALVLLAVALFAIAAGWAMLRVDRKRNA
jgi:hypothetical protein